jgi:7-carboxy-7-deazaguanine synthase
MTTVAVTPRPLFRVSEIFYSIEGEGPYTGRPTVFVRLFGCNFTCSGYSNKNNEKITPDVDGLLPKMGCDSIYSWHKDYKDRTSVYSASDLVTQILDVLPGKQISHPVTGLKPILCFTGGEPMLQQKAIAYLLDTLEGTPLFDVNEILIETNCAVELLPAVRSSFLTWIAYKEGNKLIWSNSPKLSNSGEPFHKAIRPAIYSSQQLTNPIYAPAEHIHQYLKFVSDGSSESFREIAHAVSLYSAVADIAPTDVWVMPEGHTTRQQEQVQRNVAEKCLAKGYNFSGRLHCWVWDNQKGT